MPAVLLATCSYFPDGDEDAALLQAALGRLDVSSRWVAWTDPDVDWSTGLVVLRSTWDYTHRRDDFLGWVGGLDRVANDADVVAWNTDKVYLRDLLEAGVPIVATSFAAPGEEIELPGAADFVVKPSVGAGSRGTGRFASGRADDARNHARALHDAGRTVLVQPYLEAVDTAGETSLVYVDGRFSHAIRKGPMLAADTTHPVHGASLYIEENIEPRTPSPAELEVGTLALTAVRDRFGADQLYTRVDLLPSPDGPVVIELELVEPSLFLMHGPDGTNDTRAAERLATAIAARA